MQFKLTSLFFFVFALFAVTSYALPTGVDTAVDDLSIGTNGLANDLVKRTNYPVKGDKNLAVKIMAEIKAKVHAEIVASVSATVCEKLVANLDLDVEALGGIISIEDVNIHVAQKALIKDLKLKVAAEIDAQLDAKVYANIEVQLLKLLQKKGKCSRQDLEKILIEIEASLKKQLKVKLPKICLSLKAKLDALINLSIKAIKIQLGWLLKVKLGASVKFEAAIKACVDVAIKLCAAIDVKACAKAIVKLL
ncbi:unnamed protein product [Cunninghamella echinulata]